MRQPAGKVRLRVVEILCADMWVGYLFHGHRRRHRALGARAGSHARCNRAARCFARWVIARHGGVVQTRAGDGVFAVFLNGNATRCAMELQKQLPGGRLEPG